jgi:hypothetical protein
MLDLLWSIKAMIVLNDKQKDKLSAFFMDGSKVILLGYGLNAYVKGSRGLGELLVGIGCGALFMYASLRLLKGERQ